MADARPVRVLVVDDSAFARKVLREVLAAQRGIDVVGTARDGLDALEKIAALRPDVVTLDLVMPGLDGVGVLRALPPDGAPRVVVVSSTDADTDLGLAALEAGATALVRKPTALATDRLYELEGELVQVVLAAAAARAPRASTPPAPPVVAPPGVAPSRAAGRVVVIGTSTGGPQALSVLLAQLPGDFPAPVAIALHIPPGYTEALARRLDAQCALEVVEAAEGLALRPGRVVLARAGMHLKLARDDAWGRCRLALLPLDKPHHPSVDVLFESAASWGAGALGVVLTGMGDDGLAGARAIRKAGGALLTEAEASCVVYGMPRVVREAGLAAAEAPLEQMAAALVLRLWT